MISSLHIWNTCREIGLRKSIINNLLGARRKTARTDRLKNSTRNYAADNNYNRSYLHSLTSVKLFCFLWRQHSPPAVTVWSLNLRRTPSGPHCWLFWSHLPSWRTRCLCRFDWLGMSRRTRHWMAVIHWNSAVTLFPSLRWTCNLHFVSRSWRQFGCCIRVLFNFLIGKTGEI